MSLMANPSTSKSSRDGSPFIDCFNETFQTRPRYQISDGRHLVVRVDGPKSCPKTKTFGYSASATSSTPTKWIVFRISTD
jgi:hypothetical protein